MLLEDYIVVFPFEHTHKLNDKKIMISYLTAHVQNYVFESIQKLLCVEFENFLLEELF